MNDEEDEAVRILSDAIREELKKLSPHELWQLAKKIQ